MNYQSDQGKLTAQEGWPKTVSTVLTGGAALIASLIGANNLFELVQANTTFYLVLSAALLYGAGCVRLFYYLFSKHSKRESYRSWKKALFVTFCLIIPVAGYFWTHDNDSVNSEGFRVLVANLDGPDAKFGLTQKILSRLRSRASAYDSVEVVALDNVITEQQGGDKARKEGRNKEADLVLWGRYRTFSTSSDSASAVVNAEIMGEEYVPGISAPAEPTYYSLSSPRNFRVKVAGDAESLILMTLAYAQYETASYEEAIELYTEALSQNGRLANSEMDAYLFRGLAHLRSGESDEAFEDFDHIVEVKPSYAGAWLNRGRALAQQGRHPEAIESYDQALAIDSSFFMAWANRGNVLGNPEAAKKSYRRANRIDSSEAGVWHNLGLVFIKQDSSQKAIESFDKALAIDSSLAVSWYSRGNAIRQKGNFPETKKSYRRAIEANSFLAAAWKNLADVLRTQDSLHKALKYYDRALVLDSSYAAAWNGKGLVYVQDDSLRTAKKNFRRSIQLDSSNATAWMNYGNTLSYQDSLQKAIDKYSQSLSLDSSLTLAWVNRGNALQKEDSIQKAIENYKKLSSIKPSYAKGWVLKGILHIKQGDSQSVESFTQAIRLDSSFAKAWAKRSLVHWYLGNETRAKKDILHACRLEGRYCYRGFEPEDKGMWRSRSHE